MWRFEANSNCFQARSSIELALFDDVWIREFRIYPDPVSHSRGDGEIVFHVSGWI
ncbi:MAG: hypothetical protein ACTSWN_08100 [Promethearchaeota archaeon]